MRDKQNNISKASRSVKYISGEAEEESETETEVCPDGGGEII